MELANFAADPSDTGTAWFSDSAASEKILGFLISSQLNPSKQSTSFLDLGTGNGELLFLLREEGGFKGRMLGVDYSAKSVELATSIANRAESTQDIDFRVVDLLHDDPEIGSFDVVLDKGTFDAICLSGRDGVEDTYRERVLQLVNPNGFFLLTSCNWTEEEIRQWIEGHGLQFYDRIKYPVFSFGGQTGQTISSTCFQRRE